PEEVLLHHELPVARDRDGMQAMRVHRVAGRVTQGLDHFADLAAGHADLFHAADRPAVVAPVRRRVRVRHAGPAARIEIAEAVGRDAPEVVRAASIVEEEGHDVAPHHTGQQFLALGVEYAYGAPGSLDAVGANEAAQVALGIAKEGGEPAVGPRGHSQIERELVVYRDDRTGEAVTTTRGENDGRGEPAAARHRGGLSPLSSDHAAPRVQPADEGSARQRERHAVTRGTHDRAPSPRDSGAPFPAPAPSIDEELPAEVGAEALFRRPQPHKTRVAGLRLGGGG